MVERDDSIQTASHWGVYSVDVRPDGTLGGTRGFGPDPSPSPLNDVLPRLARHRLRVERPHVRVGYLRDRRSPHKARGAGPFVPVSWETALTLVADELMHVRETYGNESIYGGSYGWASAGRLHHAPSVLKRFLGQFGGFVDKSGNHSFGAALAVVPHVLGRNDVTVLCPSWQEVWDHAELVVMFGGANPHNAQIDPGGAPIHADGAWWERVGTGAGPRVVSIGPTRDDLSAVARARWLSIRPGTDVALMLGLAHTLEVEGLTDTRFLSSHAVGYPRLRDYLLGGDSGIPRDADWAGRVCDVAPDTIRELAREMARSRTLVATAWAVQRGENGEQPVWMTLALAAMLGEIGLPGRGFGLGFGAIASITEGYAPDLPRPTLPLGTNPIATRVPVARVTEMLLHPGSELAVGGRTVRLPEIHFVYSAGGNPFHHNTNLNRFLRGWQRPDTVVVHEQFWNPAARFADIVLPATTTLERNDVMASDVHPFWVAMKKVMAPHGAARNDIDVLGELADRLGFAEAYTEGRDEQAWLRHMFDVAADKARALGIETPGFDEFWEAGHVELAPPGRPDVLLGAFRADPSANPLATPSGRIELFSETVAGFGYSEAPGHPIWQEPSEWLGSALAHRYPLHLLTHQPRHRLHSQLDHGEPSRGSKVAGREPIEIAPDDAAARGIGTGDVVRVGNDRGAFLAGAVVTEGLRSGVLRMATGAWYDPDQPGVPGALDKGGNPNVVTSDRGTGRLAQAGAAQTVLVELTRAGPEPPPVTAYDPPRLAGRLDPPSSIHPTPPVDPDDEWWVSQ